ncbi:glycosyltransferase family 1 protein [Roseovarius sp. TE539]|uniref:glycosyltransferase family 4 protein n=1 Tax=Roseovarius sp. TE539 TaxID=2249812 RepID=UPI000DDD76CF|nr:glycosyltransferase family 4 protein [Roseovarius sp. TE539]RBI69001.1 glycosyltransferase family 1 protein [Roseovarius sp. TE539]
MTDWRQQRWQIGAAVLEAGRGGIARVARMTARTLIEAGARTDIFALADAAPTDISEQRAGAFAGSKVRFAAACHAAALTHDWFLYDAVGPARAHPRLPGLRRPYGVWIHGVEVWDSLSPDRAWALRGADLVLSNSQFTLDRFQAMHFSLENVHVCRLATEDDTPPARMPQFDGPPTALLIGRSDKDNFRKGHAEVIAAWERVTAEIPEAELLLAGGGDGLDLLRETVAKSPARDRIRVLGFVPEEDMPGLWARAHAFVQPSWKEGFGLVYIEAMRHGLPVIASIHDAGQEVNLDGETGYNIDLNDCEALAARIVQLLSDPYHARALGTAGHARWQSQFRFSAFSKRLTGILDRCTGDR